MPSLRHTSAKVDLALDLLASPAGGLNGPRAVLAGGTGLADESGDPVVAEVMSQLAVGEGIGKITENTHRGTHQALAAVTLLRNDVKELEDGLDEWLELSDRRCALVRKQDTTPGIHDTLAEGDNVVDHVVWKVGAGGDRRGLLENTADNSEVSVELGSNSLGNVTESLQDGRLELVGSSL